MSTPKVRTALAVLRTKTAAEAKSTGVRDLLGSARRGVGHVWDAANKGSQAMAEHLDSVKAPKILSGAVHALPVGVATYGAYKTLKGVSDWNKERVLRKQMAAGGYQ
jgi:hypothetical protein